MADSDFDMANLRMTPETVARHEQRRRKRGQYFVRFPTAWLDRLGSPRHAATYPVAIHLLYRHFRTGGGGKPLALTNVALKELGISRYSKRRALDELEEAGLIRIEKQPRKNPVVHLLAME